MCHTIDILKLCSYEFYLTFYQVILVDFKTSNTHAKISSAESKQPVNREKHN